MSAPEGLRPLRRLAVFLGESPAGPERVAAGLLVARIRRRCGAAAELLDAPPPGWAPGEAVRGFDGAFWLGRTEGHAALGALLRRAGRRAPDALRPGPEGYRLRTLTADGQPQALVAGADARGTLYGVGALLRALTYGDGSAGLPALDVASAPAFRYRGQALRQFANPTIPERGMRPWDAADWEEQIADLALWGCNLIRSQIIWYWFDRWRSEAEGDGTAGAGAAGGPAAQTWELLKEVCRTVGRYGLDVGVYYAPNSVAEAWAGGPHMTPELRGTHAYPRLICASHPEALARIRRERELLFQELPRIDHLFFPSGDSAGCSCPSCHPWVQTYLRRCEEQAALLRRYHPGAEVWLTNQHLDAEQDQLLWDHLRERRPAWVTGYQYGPAGDEMWPYIRAEVHPAWFTYPAGGRLTRYLTEIRAQLPPELPVTLFPDLTHFIQSQYGLEGTDPAVVALHTRRTAFVRPADYRRLFEATAPLSAGSCPYSEGIYDDLNRVLWLQWEWAPELGIGPGAAAPERPALEAYTRWWFGERHAARVADVYAALERAWRGPILDNPEIAPLRAAVEAIDAELPPRYREGNWRWLLVRLRALADVLLQRKLRLAAQAARDLAAALRPDSPPADGDDLARRLAAGRELLDAAAGEATLVGLKRDLLDLDAALHALPGARIHLPLIARLDAPLGDGAWANRRLAAAGDTLAAGDLPAAWALVRRVTGYEDAGPGGWYDDLGHPARAPHLRRGHPIALTRQMDAANRPTQNTHARTYRGEPGVLLAYTGLDPRARYRVRFTCVAAARRGGTGIAQRLEASGLPVHDALEVPAATAGEYVFPLPPAAHRYGDLELEWLPAPGSAGTAVSEVWLERVP